MQFNNSKIWFIYNPNSARVLKKGSLLKKHYRRFNAQLHSLEKFSDVQIVVSKALENKVSYVCIEGGDGTTHGVITAVSKTINKFKLFHFLY